MSTATNDSPISADLLEILRDPLAVQEKEKYGDDPGHLELVHGCWLVSKDTGLKYPIKDGIPVMLIEEGQKWKDTAVEDLPVPPPPLIPETPFSASTPDLNADSKSAGKSGPDPKVLIGFSLAVFVLLVLLFGKKKKK